MTEELKTCPFCGGEVKWREYSFFAKRIAIEKGLPLVPMIRCESCGAMVSFDPIEDPEPNYKKEAAGTLWNTRRERTCKMIKIHVDDYSFQCSECSAVINYFSKGNYCLSCGAKVVEDD